MCPRQIAPILLLGALGCATTSPQPEAPMPDTSAQLPSPPVAATKPYVHTEHGVERPDPYYWLKERDDPEVLAYIEAENAYTEAVTAHLAPLRAALFDEMKARLMEDDREAPVHHGPWLYYSKTEAGKSYPIHCRLDADHQGKAEQIILDENQLAEGHSFFDLGMSEVSPDHRYLAYAVDTKGNEIHTVYVKDLTTGELLPDVIEGVADTLTWAADSKTLFYSTLDEALRPWQIHRHALGDKEDALVYQEDDDRFWVSVRRSRSDAFLFIAAESAITTEVRVIDAHAPTSPPRLLSPRHQGMEYYVSHHDDRFLIVTNDADDPEGKHTDNAINFKLMTAPLSSSDRSQWEELIGHRPEVLLDDVEPFRDHLVISEREGGHAQITVWDLETDEKHRVRMPEPSYSLWLEENPTYDTHRLRIGYTSLVTPESIFEYDMGSRDLHLIKEKPVLGGFDTGHYEARYIHATAPDGTKVPISLVFKRGMEPDGTHPTLLYGYGAYGALYDPEFSSARLNLIDRGIVFAIAHIRGGGELGRPWYVDGKLLNKKNTFTDFIAAGQALIDAGWADPKRLAIRGGSAGGLLIGAAINNAPDLFHTAIAEVPFVDVVTTMFDETIPLTVTEWEEWGDPRDRASFDYMLSYSPYDNVAEVSYPNLLIMSGLNDARVQYWEPTKWAARMRATAKGDQTLLLKTNMEAGHGGASGRYDVLKEEAFVQAFLLDSLGLQEDTF